MSSDDFASAILTTKERGTDGRAPVFFRVVRLSLIFFFSGGVARESAARPNLVVVVVVDDKFENYSTANNSLNEIHPVRVSN